MSLADAMARAEDLRAEINDRRSLLTEVELEIAKLSAPVAPGDRIRTNRGLGLSGLVVDSIGVPAFPASRNRWSINTFAISKAGEVTKRSVSISEQDVNLLGVIIVKE